MIFIKHGRASKVLNSSVFLQEDARDLDAYTLAKSYFDLKEYDRAAYFLRGCKSQKAYFLYMYSRYLVRQKEKLPLSTELLCFLSFPHVECAKPYFFVYTVSYVRLKIWTSPPPLYICKRRMGRVLVGTVCDVNEIQFTCCYQNCSKHKEYAVVK